MGALLPVSATTGWNLQLEALIVSKANMIRFSSNGIMLNGSVTLLLPIHDDTIIDNEEFAPNTLIPSLTP